jgi:hypothetical protein
MDASYDSSDIYEYIFENTKGNPVIDTKRRREIFNSILDRPKKKNYGSCGMRKYETLYYYFMFIRKS